MVVHLKWCFKCFLLYTGKMGLDGGEVQFYARNSTDRTEQIQKITSDVCQSFFVWNKDLETNSSVSDELAVFVKTLDKVNEKPVGGNLSIHPSPSIHLFIYPSIHQSINPSIHFLYRWCGQQQ